MLLENVWSDGVARDKGRNCAMGYKQRVASEQEVLLAIEATGSVTHEPYKARSASSSTVIALQSSSL